MLNDFLTKYIYLRKKYIYEKNIHVITYTHKYNLIIIIIIKLILNCVSKIFHDELNSIKY